MKAITKAKWRPNYIPTRDGVGRVRWHKARVPSTIRASRAPGGSGFRGWKQWRAHHEVE